MTRLRVERFQLTRPARQPDEDDRTRRPPRPFGLGREQVAHGGEPAQARQADRFQELAPDRIHGVARLCTFEAPTVERYPSPGLRVSWPSPGGRSRVITTGSGCLQS